MNYNGGTIFVPFPMICFGPQLEGTTAIAQERPTYGAFKDIPVQQSREGTAVVLLKLA